MIDRRFILEAGTLIGAAVVCALVANGFAASTRKVELPGDYPNARTIRPAASPDGGASPAGGASLPAASPAPVAAAAAALTSAELKARFPPHPDRASVEIESDDAEALHRAGAPFLDARRTDVYAEGHIAGAWSLPVWEADLEAKLDAFLGSGITPEEPLVIYCAGGECEDSHMLSERLSSRGFTNALVYKDGFPDWEKKGRAVAKGAERGGK